MDDFHDLVPDARRFFDGLRANNTREYFADHKGDYEAQVKRPAGEFLEVIRMRIEGDLGAATIPKMFRVNRDLRFSKDKTPYNTHLHLQWSMEGAPVCFLFGAAQDYVKLGVGAMVFPKESLVKWRENLGAGATVADEARALVAAGWSLSEPELKRVPAPYDQDHPEGAHLRRKGLVAWYDLTEAEIATPTATLAERFHEADRFRGALLEALS